MNDKNIACCVVSCYSINYTTHHYMNDTFIKCMHIIHSFFFLQMCLTYQSFCYMHRIHNTSFILSSFFKYTTHHSFFLLSSNTQHIIHSFLHSSNTQHIIHSFFFFTQHFLLSSNTQHIIHSFFPSFPPPVCSSLSVIHCLSTCCSSVMFV